MYKIVRMFGPESHKRNITIKTGLTLEEAQAHCRNPETSSRTGRSSKAKAYTKLYGAWFDGYEET